ncbi:uncharacterized protein AB9X84_020112 [Acanthopagrus schlegelii]
MPKLKSRVLRDIPKRELGVPRRRRPKGPSAQPVAHVDPCQRWGISVRGAANEVNISELRGGGWNVVVHSPGTSPDPRVRSQRQPPAEDSPDVGNNPPSARQPELLSNRGAKGDLATDPPVVQGFDPQVSKWTVVCTLAIEEVGHYSGKDELGSNTNGSSSLVLLKLHLREGGTSPPG